MNIKILHLYPDLLNLYGDKGNIESLRHRLLWRGIDVEVVSHTSGNGGFDLSDIDIVFLGGGSDREEKLVCAALCEHKKELRDFVENNGTLIATCGGFMLLGKYYELDGEKVEGPGVLDIYTGQGKDRLISDVVLEADFINQKIVGFENHGGRTFTGDYAPLGRVLYGNGNSDGAGVEGVHYKNVIATYLHGPLLPKNPELCDYILTQALKNKYADFTELSALDDEIENKANETIVSRFVK